MSSMVFFYVHFGRELASRNRCDEQPSSYYQSIDQFLTSSTVIPFNERAPLGLEPMAPDLSDLFIQVSLSDTWFGLESIENYTLAYLEGTDNIAQKFGIQINKPHLCASLVQSICHVCFQSCPQPHHHCSTVCSICQNIVHSVRSNGGADDCADFPEFQNSKAGGITRVQTDLHWIRFRCGRYSCVPKMEIVHPDLNTNMRRLPVPQLCLSRRMRLGDRIIFTYQTLSTAEYKTVNVETLVSVNYNKELTYILDIDFELYTPFMRRRRQRAPLPN
ncbi:hypothetical protein ACTXT7_015509 [Hymenolepis weldensis]